MKLQPETFVLLSFCFLSQRSPFYSNINEAATSLPAPYGGISEILSYLLLAKLLKNPFLQIVNHSLTYVRHKDMQ